MEKGPEQHSRPGLGLGLGLVPAVLADGGVRGYENENHIHVSVQRKMKALLVRLIGSASANSELS